MPKRAKTVVHNGKTYTYQQAADYLKISLFGFRYRLTHYPEHLWFSDSLVGTTFTVKGQTHTVREWAELTGINASTIHSRLRSGIRGDKLIEPPRKAKARGKRIPKQNKVQHISRKQMYYRDLVARFRNTEVEYPRSYL